MGLSHLIPHDLLCDFGHGPVLSGFTFPTDRLQEEACSFWLRTFRSEL